MKIARVTRGFGTLWRYLTMRQAGLMPIPPGGPRMLAVDHQTDPFLKTFC